MAPRTVGNKNRFPTLVTHIDLENDGSTPQVYTHTGRNAKLEVLMKNHPTHIIQIWEPQDVISHVEYNCMNEGTLYYYNQLKADYDWSAIVANAKENPFEEDGQLFGSDYLGSVTSMWPSGKFYTAWANGNATEDDIDKDTLFTEALERLCEEHGGSLSSGEGDPLDQYFIIVLERPEETEDEDSTAQID